ncbi:hypothetical protein BLA23254_07657 [Burkholderia lata]|uniref:Peptidase C80 domain-containing protein n=1 Tax=Burkholderia lata (strain ATCC 17760 / DSM 23089 / LMG 22485 / NCIMB 9086 / R18194 / 383) TaxID=482957 RepID=A0A6P2SFP2_BURL3|nr:C80 family cysteine peptidase [Burkholderia lata]VWC49380.1 hypothetical protein BLA23254_07657 [Burkholderia lata]
MSSAYNKQIIINFLNGNGDRTILDGTNAIVAKGARQGVRSTVFNANRCTTDEIAREASSTMGPWRLYLRGHGDFQRKTLGGKRPDAIASFLLAIIDQGNLPDVISVTGCRLALGPTQIATQAPNIASKDSFVGDLHRMLGEHNIHVRMSGRAMLVSVHGAGTKIGRKITFISEGQYRHHEQSRSKVIFFWDENGNQQCKFSWDEMDLEE